LNKQLELAGISKGTYYYKHVPESTENLSMMENIDKIYLEHPYYGSRRITAQLRNEGYEVNRKKVVRLMSRMGLQAVYPKSRFKKSSATHKKYPYLLKDCEICRPNQVWATDITYIPVRGGFLYLTVILDLYSRYVLSWRLSNTLDVIFCVDALKEALDKGCPEIFNSDQGVQYTALEFTKVLLDHNIVISMTGKGRAHDNIFVERLWRSVKYEEVYLKRYENGFEAHRGLEEYLECYNEKRLHQALGYKTPKSVYFSYSDKSAYDVI